MAEAIKDGAGGGYQAKVGSDNRLTVRSVDQTEIEEATGSGYGFNINTGEISISADSALLYFKNNEDEDLYIDAFVVGLTDGTQSDIQKISVIKNPTTGTIISGASDVAMNENRNFGSARELSDSLAYKGASGNTFTDGSNFGLFFMTDNGRLYASLDVVLPKNTSIGIEIDVNLSSGSMGVYAALICHQKEIIL